MVNDQYFEWTNIHVLNVQGKSRLQQYKCCVCIIEFSSHLPVRCVVTLLFSLYRIVVASLWVSLAQVVLNSAIIGGYSLVWCHNTHSFFIFIDKFTGTLGCFCDAKQIILYVPILQILFYIANKKFHWKNNYGSYNILKNYSYMTKIQ